MSRRIQRLNGLFREEISDLIRSELRDPRLPELVSVTRVEISPDLKNANVLVSVLGSDDDKVATMRALTATASLLRHHLSERVPIRRIPNLRFVLDESIEEAAHILELMRRVSESGQE